MKTVINVLFIFLLAFCSNLWAMVDIEGEWIGTCKSSLSGNSFDAEASFSQSGNAVSGNIAIILPFTDLTGEVSGTVSGFSFTGTWTESGGDCPDPTAFEYEVSTDWNTMTGWLSVNCPDFGGEITYGDCILSREVPVTTSSTSSSSTSTTTTASPTAPCPVETIYGRTSGEAQLLRSLRDNILSKTQEGQEITKLYYYWSPAVVKAMKNNEALKKEVKELIDGFLGVVMQGE